MQEGVTRHATNENIIITTTTIMMMMMMIVIITIGKRQNYARTKSLSTQTPQALNRGLEGQAHVCMASPD